MAFKNVAIALLTLFLFSSCVSSKVHKDLQSQFDSLETRNQKLSNELRETRNKGERDLATLQEEHNRLKAEKEKLQSDLLRTRENLESLTQSFDALEANSSSALAEN